MGSPKEASRDQPSFRPCSRDYTTQLTSTHNFQPNAVNHHDHPLLKSLRIVQTSGEGTMSVSQPQCTFRVGSSTIVKTGLHVRSNARRTLFHQSKRHPRREPFQRSQSWGNCNGILYPQQMKVVEQYI